VALTKNNLRRLLLTVEALSDLGPQMTSDRDFTHIARGALAAVLEAAAAREGAIFTFSDKPALITTIAAQGFTLMPEPAFIPLLPRHVHALSTARGPRLLTTNYDTFFSSNGNVAPELFKCIAPLTVGGKLVGMIALGRR